ncbi:jg7497 [Pararge aegeria aegeria]|uniref:Jg7497 protein n=1 Tax=Pararge aegeria aegeria TaxID=348720 RepID=A0A8S4RFP5_9NEOP|nr:jg7497 [Pararge aegeria aegeria]
MCKICETSINWVIVLSHEQHSKLLTTFTFAVSTFGMVLSIIALVLLLLTALLFIEWRKIYKNQVLIQFMIARFLYSAVRYFYDITQLFDIRPSYFHPIYLDAIPLAYTEMVLVTWMCIFSKLMYESFVKVFNVGTPSLLKLSLAAWLVPGELVRSFLTASNENWSKMAAATEWG